MLELRSRRRHRPRQMFTWTMNSTSKTMSPTTSVIWTGLPYLSVHSRAIFAANARTCTESGCNGRSHVEKLTPPHGRIPWLILDVTRSVRGHWALRVRRKTLTFRSQNSYISDRLWLNLHTYIPAIPVFELLNIPLSTLSIPCPWLLPSPSISCRRQSDMS